MIYVDGKGERVTYDTDRIAQPARKHGHEWYHLFTDSEDLEELHAFAARLGLRRAWFQTHPIHPHYDVTPSKKALALKLGATHLTRMEAAEFWAARIIARRSISTTQPAQP